MVSVRVLQLCAGGWRQQRGQLQRANELPHRTRAGQNHPNALAQGQPVYRKSLLWFLIALVVARFVCFVCVCDHVVCLQYNAVILIAHAVQANSTLTVLDLSGTRAHALVCAIFELVDVLCALLVVCSCVVEISNLSVSFVLQATLRITALICVA